MRREGLRELIDALGDRVEVIPAPASFARAVECHKIVHEYEICRHLSEELESALGSGVAHGAAGDRAGPHL